EVYGSERNRAWLEVSTPTEPLTEHGSWVCAPNAAGATELLVRAAMHWHQVLEATDDEHLAAPLGAMAGQYAGGARAGFVLHQLDEAIHHGAEVGVLRDLYAATHGDGPVDPTAADLATEPNAVARAADIGRWDLVEELVLAGHDVNSPGRTPLHQAAAMGHTEIVELLLANGASVDVVDPQWHGTPLSWAEVFGRTGTAELLRRTTGSDP
ncbi:MAG TPA: ankyrin repeat domain-containing protein, partial [Acidimicrobiales bacterium]|nr:ankyrin repeat domain-containing protein [Acidimicrobiales bacterium]